MYYTGSASYTIDKEYIDSLYLKISVSICTTLALIPSISQSIAFFTAQKKHIARYCDICMYRPVCVCVKSAMVS